MLSKLRPKCKLSIEIYKNYSKLEKVMVNINQSTPETSSYADKLHQEWQQAKLFKSLPGPTKFQKFRGFLKGGEFYGQPFDEVLRMCRKRYGDIYLLPGMFGQNTNLITFNVDDYEKIFRTEGLYPHRPGFEVIMHYRLRRKDKLYDREHLGVIGSGSQWGKFRHAANPVLMQPKNSVLYMDAMQKVNNDFIKRIRQIRDHCTLEVPPDFISEIHRLSFESDAVVALDKELGLVRHDSALPEAEELFANLQAFNLCLYDLGIQPSIYKYYTCYKTPTYKRFEKAIDTMTNICCKFIEETLQRIEMRRDTADDGQSVLEKLIKIDRRIAIIIAIDMLITGVEATSTILSAILLCLATNPEKQKKLREEILNNIGKSSAFTMENMKHLPYLRACIKEAMRMYPAIIGNLRATGMDLSLSGYRIPRGTNVFLVSNMLLLEECYFPKPQEFIPERWLRSTAREMDDLSVKNINPFIFLPLGYGPRSCLGKRIVDMELEMTLANIVRNFKMEYNYSMENAFRSYFINTCALPLKFTFKDLH